ncbi:hypothetical protein [Actinoplanes sp. NBRC 101535]|uniref:hypothetical protein n=1 Tax=Actinoplanes sp. NBRC 101535 TaxID=3032196 RepID=UPI0024A55AF5|nr:hypothetical protein [Actinoplanes sp. NBRC 101535]GLY06441.1 hypothetical protein Acsp01_68200 [Actinoplanes sp. NBRC 101535]
MADNGIVLVEFRAGWCGVLSKPGAPSAAALEQVIAAVEGLDMEDVRAEIAAKTAGAKG